MSDNDIGAGKALWVGTRKVNCRAATELRIAAQFLHDSKSALGDFYRRMRAKPAAPKEITAAAQKLARILFHLITTGQQFDDSRFAADRLRYQKRQEIKLRAKAKGFKLIPLEQSGCVPQKRGQNARRSKIGLRHEACGEAAKGRGVLPVQTRRRRVKAAAVDSALIAENIVE